LKPVEWTGVRPWVTAVSKLYLATREPVPWCCNLFLYLWAPSCLGPCCPGLAIPDTLLVQDGKVSHWFFTSPKNGVLRRKSHDMTLDKDAIYAAFTAGPASQTRRGTVALHIIPDSSVGGGTITPLDAKALSDCIAERTMSDGQGHTPDHLTAHPEPFLSMKTTRRSPQQVLTLS